MLEHTVPFHYKFHCFRDEHEQKQQQQQPIKIKVNVCNVCVNNTDMIMPTPAYSHLIHCSRFGQLSLFLFVFLSLSLASFEEIFDRPLTDSGNYMENYFKTHLLRYFVHSLPCSHVRLQGIIRACVCKCRDGSSFMVTYQPNRWYNFTFMVETYFQRCWKQNRAVISCTETSANTHTRSERKRR